MVNDRIFPLGSAPPPASGEGCALTRRGVLKLCVAMPVAAAIGMAFPRAAMAQVTALHSVVYDRRTAAGAAFAQSAQALRIPRHPIAGDVTALWSDILAPLWRGADAAIAGVTLPASLFCLEQLAWQFGLRVVHRGELTDAGVGGFDRLLPVLGDHARRPSFAETASVRAPMLNRNVPISWVIAPGKQRFV